MTTNLTTDLDALRKRNLARRAAILNVTPEQAHIESLQDEIRALHASNSMLEAELVEALQHNERRDNQDALLITCGSIVFVLLGFFAMRMFA